MSLSRLSNGALVSVAVAGLLTATAGAAAYAAPRVNTDFSSTVEHLASAYPGAFAGVRVTPGASETPGPAGLTVYVVSSQAGRFRSALHASSAGVPMTVVNVPHSWTQLTDVTNQISAADSTWSARA
jgi:hypothetical protein